MKRTLIDALRNASAELMHSPSYQWGHMGSCNCGFLAQKLTGLTKAEIHACAMQKQGDWADQLKDYCPGSGYPMDRLIFDLLQHGLSTTELAQLERLSNPAVRDRVRQEMGRENLRYNCAGDVALYMNAWADLLEEALYAERKTTRLFEEPVRVASIAMPIIAGHVLLKKIAHADRK